jgi:hypothetical protein
MPQAFRFGQSGADDAQLAAAVLIREFLDHHYLYLVGADVDACRYAP